MPVSEGFWVLSGMIGQTGHVSQQVNQAAQKPSVYVVSQLGSLGKLVEVLRDQGFLEKVWVRTF